MNQHLAYFTLGIVIILISTPLAYTLVNVLYQNQNLTGEYVPILNGFIHSLMLVGLVLCSIGLVAFIKNKK
ncbi:glycosyl transferase [Lentibacillus salicampi]|uniref:Glycosyl transferase n=1 Tax=Lentibacillus salicampi TaxID=175306 RepID=A0A4Y9A8L1_9BACI|nr:glycosyl transferase [Lentibacillus salicampi]